MIRFLILLIVCVALFYSAVAEAFFGADVFGLSTLAKILFSLVVLITVFKWWRGRSRRASDRLAALDDELPQVLNEVSSYLKGAESGISQVGNPPAVVVLKNIRFANEGVARAYKIVRDGSPQLLDLYKARLAEVMVPEEEVKAYLAGKGSLDDISGIERFIAPSREALGKLRFETGW